MEKKKTNIFFKILWLLFLIYLVLFLTSTTGYYEKHISKKAQMTEEKIREFEKAIENGEIININAYLPEQKDYSNIFTKSANTISNKLSLLVSKKADNIVDFFKSLFIG